MRRNRVWTYAAILFVLTAAILTTQVVWIFQSATLEEGFLNQRVNMALCSAMDVLSKDKGICSNFESCTSYGAGAFALTLDEQEKAKIDSVITQHMLFYNINVPFQTTLSRYKTTDDSGKPLPSNQALLYPTAKAGMQNVLVEIAIPSKNDLIRAQINGTFMLSIVLLLLLIGVFVQALRALARERKIRSETVEFINTMAHDLKTPISNISFALSLFKRNNSGMSGSGGQYISIIDAETERLKQRAKQILGAASVDAVLEETKKTAVNVHDLIKHSIDSFSTQFSQTKANVSVDLNANNATVVVSPVQLSSAVMNIIDNALSYSSVEPKVVIRTENDSSCIKIEIEDNGPGIAPEEQELVFRKGYRVDASRKTTEGFGLGLYLAKTLVEKQGGSLSLFSNGVNGSRFTIQLPVA